MTTKYRFTNLDNDDDNNINTESIINMILKGGNGNNLLTQANMNIIYNFPLQSITSNNMDNSELVKSTYGEILFDSVEKLISVINTRPTDIFYDLGSGNGKVVMQMFLNSNVAKSYGIEFYRERSYNAEIALKNMYKLYPKTLDGDRIISYQIQNIKDLYFLDNATIIFMCSTCYPSELLDAVYTKLLKSSNIRCVITHKEYPKFLTFLPILKKIVLPCTWNTDLTWHIYSK
jgi:hypothetical protein